MTGKQSKVGAPTDPSSFPSRKIMEILRRTVAQWEAVPYVTECARATRDPFRVLISTILSLRSRDLPTRQATEALFALAATPAQMMVLPAERIAEAIRLVIYYNNKARTIRDLSRILVEQYGERVPDQLEELLKLKGVGRKTANLVVTLAFGKPGICVDTHVHRICNRMWAIRTKDPEQTETWLRAHLPGEYWIEINTWMVAFGQRNCRPVSPWCSACPLHPHCRRRGITRSR